MLFEMLTGTRAFEGEDVGQTLARVVEREPDFGAFPPSVPARVNQVLRVCLRKDPKQRVGDIGAVRLALEGAFETTAPQTTAPSTASASSGRLPSMAALAVAALVIIALAIPAVRHLRETPPPAPPETRVEIVTPATGSPTMFALSPDGRQIAFVASGDGAPRLWLRSLATTTAQPLAGTEGARYPFWSPDGRSIGFFAEAALKRLDLGGGAPQTLAPAINGAGGTWNADGVIVFAPTQTAPLMRVSATGGAAAAVTTLGSQSGTHPWFLPDGRRFLFYAAGAPDTAGIYLGALDGSAPTRLTPADSAGVYLTSGQTSLAVRASAGSAEASSESGWLLWTRTGTLVAQRLDLEKAALTGEPVTLADGVAVDNSRRSAFSAAATGLVTYRTGVRNQRQLAWVDRSGTARGTVGDPDATLTAPRVSPDGRRVVVVRTVQSNQDLWLLDGARTSRFTFDPAAESFPLWSPDGTRIVFRSIRTGLGDLYQKLTSGAGVEERLVASDQIKSPSSWSADGRTLLYHSTDPQTNTDIWAVPMVGDRTPAVYLKTPFRENWGVFSPDGRWVAYHSNESGRMEIYVRPFVLPSPQASADEPSAAGTAEGAERSVRLQPDLTGGQWQVSTAGGVYPVWRPDGKELYYLNPAGEMMAAPLAFTGPTFEPGAPVVLFPTRIYGGGEDVQQGRQYDVTADGRFLINAELDDTTGAPITLIQNWNPEAR